MKKIIVLSLLLFIGCDRRAMEREYTARCADTTQYRIEYNGEKYRLLFPGGSEAYVSPKLEYVIEKRNQLARIAGDMLKEMSAEWKEIKP